MKMKQMNKWMLASILMLSGLTTLTSCSKDEENVEKTAEVVRSWGLEPVIPYGIPVLCGFPAGHGDVNLPLVMGAPVTIDVRSDGATLTFDIDGTPREVRTADITVAKTPAAIRPENATPHSDHCNATLSKRERSENGRKESLSEGDYSFNVVS